MLYKLCCCSVAKSRLTVIPWTAVHQAPLSATISHLLKFMSIESLTLSNHLIFCNSLLLPSIFPSMRVFSNELALHFRWLHYWSFNFSTSPSNEYSRWISFRINWFDILAVQGTLKGLLQHHGLKASIHRPSAFFMYQISYPYQTTGKTIALIIWTFVSKVISLLFNMLSRFVIAFFQGASICSFHGCSHFLSNFGPQEKKIFTVSTFPLSICHEVVRSDVMILAFSMLSFKPAFSPFVFHPYQKALNFSLLSAIWVVASVYQRLLILSVPYPAWHFTWCTPHRS